MGSDLDFFEEDAFLPCFLVVAGFFFWAVTGSDAEGAEGVGVGAGAGSGMLSLGSGAGVGRGVEDSSWGAGSRFRVMRPLPSRLIPAREREVRNKRVIRNWIE